VDLESENMLNHPVSWLQYTWREDLFTSNYKFDKIILLTSRIIDFINSIIELKILITILNYKCLYNSKPIFSYYFILTSYVSVFFGCISCVI